MTELDDLDRWVADNLLWIEGVVIPLGQIHKELLAMLPKSDRKYWPWRRIRHRLRDLTCRLQPDSSLVLANACWRRPRLIPGADDLLPGRDERLIYSRDWFRQATRTMLQ